MARSLLQRKPLLRGQLRTCLRLSALAVAVTLLFQSGPAFREWRAGQDLGAQAVTVAGVAIFLCFGRVFVALCLPFFVRHIQVPLWFDLDLSGHMPWFIGVTAGIGEELLFRAALLPLFGLWVSSLLFALAHVGTARLAPTRFQQVSYLANLFVLGVVLGLVFVHIGLLAAIGVHAVIDAINLSALHKFRQGIS